MWTFLAMSDEYSVEKILRERKGENGRPEFLIKWKGYAAETWEPLSNLTHCKRAMKAFKVSFSIFFYKCEKCVCLSVNT